VDDIYVYNFVSQGKITIPSMDDSEEMGLTDVRKSCDTQVFSLITSGETSSLKNFTLASTLSFANHLLISSSVAIVIQNNFPQFFREEKTKNIHDIQLFVSFPPHLQISRSAFKMI
jgi:hypothetical protein